MSDDARSQAESSSNVDFDEIDRRLEGSSGTDGDGRRDDSLVPEIASDVSAVLADRRAILTSLAGNRKSPQRGQRFGRFLLTEKCGSGAQGTVFRAFDERLGRDVALKVLDARFAPDSSAWKRFEIEARAASRIDHPAVCAVYDAGKTKDHAWIAMRHVVGKTLSQLIEDGAASGPPDSARLRSAMILVEKCARGAHAAHLAGVVHRDLKPGNIIVDATQNPVIVDFGLARAIGIEATLDGAGPLGTPSYMAPEQILPSIGAIDARTDVWALGAILYELATGSRPFAAESREALYRAILEASYMDPRRRNPTIGKDLAAVIGRALLRDPERRWKSAAELADDLREVVEGRPCRARRVGIVEKTRSAAARNPIAAGLVVAIIVILAISVVAVYAALRAARADEALAKRNEERAIGHRLIAEAQVIGQENPGLAVLTCLEGQLRAPDGAAADVLLRLLDEPFEDDLLEPGDGPLESAHFTDRDRIVVTRSESGALAAISAADSRAIWRLRNRRLRAVATTDDTVVAVDGRAILIIDPTSGAVRRRFDDAVAAEGPVVACAGQTAFAVSDPDGRIVIGDTSSAKTITIALPNKMAATALAVDRSETRLAAGFADGTTGVTLIASPQWATQRLHDLFVRGLSFSTDGLSLASASADNRAVVRRLDDSAPPVLFRGHESGVHSVIFVGTDSLWTSSADRTIAEWDAASGRRLRDRRGHRGWVGGLGLSRDGKRVVSASLDGTARIWPIDAPSGRWVGEERSGMFARAVPADFGRRVVTLSGDGRFVLRDRSNGRPIETAATFAGLGAVAVASDDVTIAALARSGRLLVVDARDGKLVFEIDRLDPAVDGATYAAPVGVVWDPRGRYILATTGDGKGYLIDVEKRSIARRIECGGPHFPTGNVECAAFSSSGDRLFVVGPNEERNEIRVINVATGAIESKYSLERAQISVVIRLRDDRIIAGDLEGRLHVIERDGTVRSMAAEPKAVLDIAVFPDQSDTVAVVGHTGNVSIVDIASGKVLNRFGDHDGLIYDVAVAPDGRFVATASWDGTAALFDSRSGRRIATEKGHGRPVVSITFTPDSSSVISSAIDGATRLWPIDPIAVAARAIRRSLTDAERRALDLDEIRLERRPDADVPGPVRAPER